MKYKGRFMRTIFSHPYSEEFARQCIMHCFPELGWNLQLNNNDPPDLTDDIKGVGIEVTGTNQDAEVDFLFEKYAKCEKKTIPERAIKTVESSQARFIYSNVDGKELLEGCLHRVRQLDFENTIQSVIKKTERLNSRNYKYYSIDGLFVNDSDSFLFDKGAPEIMDRIESKCACFERRYSTLFVFCHHDIYMMDMVSREVKAKPITDEEIEEIKKKTCYAIGRKREYDERSYFLIDNTV